MTISSMINMAEKEQAFGVIGQVAQLNESDNVGQLTHSQQIMNLPTLKTRTNRDETMTTEMEYVNFMKDNNFRASLLQQDESFFRSILKVDKGESVQLDEKANENQALIEINEQQLKKIQELTKQVCDLEEENIALEQEHLVMVKKQ